MPGLRHAWTDQEIDLVIGGILRIGVALAALVVLAGGTLYLIRHGFEMPDYRAFRGEPTDLCTITGILRDVRLFRARGFIQLGLLLLIATPIIRVLFTILAFALQRDRTYVMVTLIVLAALLFSLAGGWR